MKIMIIVIIILIVIMITKRNIETWGCGYSKDKAAGIG